MSDYGGVTIVAKILANRLSKVIESIISHGKSSLLRGEQIFDGPLILSETIDLYKKRKKKMMLFKAEFEKAFNYVSWRNLDYVLDKSGFEFSLKRGFRQGDPLSPFLFIIIIEALHMALNNGLAANIFHGIKVGSPVGVSSNEVEIMASYMGCEASFFPFTYIGLPIGSNMSRITNWQPPIDRFKARLSGWKANLFFIGGCLTLIIYVLSSLASLDKGCLGVGSLKAFNMSLLLKWRWRLFHNPNALWVLVTDIDKKDKNEAKLDKTEHSIGKSMELRVRRFDQFQPPQYPVLHQPRQEMSTEMLLAKEKLIKAIRTCLKNNNQPPEEKSIAVLLAEESILTVMQTLKEKQIDTESMQESLLQFSKDLPTFESIDETPPSDAITPDLPITNSLVMEDEHLDTILKMDSDEEIESSVEKLNLTPSESEDLSDYVSECDLPFCDNSLAFKNDSEIFSNPLFDSNTDYTSSDDESSSEEDVPNSGTTTIHTDISLPEYESLDDESDSAYEIFNDDLAHIISSSEYEYVYADDESDLGDLTTDVVEDILGDSTRKLQMSHLGFKALKISHNFFNKSPVMIYGGDMPILDVTDIHKKTKTRQKPDKTEHGIGKSVENRSRRRMHLSGPTQPKLMGQVSPVLVGVEGGGVWRRGRAERCVLGRESAVGEWWEGEGYGGRGGVE
ncbi:putative RNA-directed DNA polymerase, eukaryota, reverse transcriptase zinc-binding domain protein [Tanacetum coccineum]